MDRRSALPALVRHNLEGLSAVFPPAYLLAFTMNGAGEPMHDAPDMRLYFRSRMAGVVGLCFRIDEFDEGDLAAMRHQIALYKYLRAPLTESTQALLTPQASTTQAPAWDVLQMTPAAADQPRSGERRG